MSESLINNIIACAKDVYKELGSGWSESVYQRAMEVVLRERGVEYDNLRTVTISYKGHIVGDAQIDLLVYSIDDFGGKLILVVELKAVDKLTEGFRTQVNKYVKELMMQCQKNELVSGALLINFSNEGKGKKLSDEIEDNNGMQVLKCMGVINGNP
jgi:GxxExxY protein